MRRIIITFLATVSAVVLAFSYHTSSDGAGVPGEPVPQTRGGSAAQSPTGSSSATPVPAATGSPPAASSAVATYVGAVAATRWGPVQVQITVSAGRITNATAVRYPTGNGRDAQINRYALPILGQEVVQQQSADVDTVSGATVTSDGYLQSLQSAIDQAHL